MKLTTIYVLKYLKRKNVLNLPAKRPVQSHAGDLCRGFVILLALYVLFLGIIIKNELGKKNNREKISFINTNLY
jgi:hypothetical protein